MMHLFYVIDVTVGLLLGCIVMMLFVGSDRGMEMLIRWSTRITNKVMAKLEVEDAVINMMDNMEVKKESKEE